MNNQTKLIQDLHLGLVVRRRREDLLRLARNRGVPLDQLGRDATQGLDAQGERGHVEQEHVLDLAGQHAALHGRAHRDDLVGVHRLVRILAEELLDLLLHQRDPRRATHQNDLVDLAGREAGVRKRAAAGLERTLDQVLDELLELGARELQRQVLRARLVRSDVG